MEGIVRHGESTVTYFDKTTQTFLMRVWLEPREIQSAAPVWRGMIECMHDNERFYFQSLSQLGVFIGAHLEQMGANPKELHPASDEQTGPESSLREDNRRTESAAHHRPTPLNRAKRP